MDDKKIQKQLEEAKKDSIWAEKVREAATAEELIQLYKEKGIELPENIKVKLCQTEKRTEKLNDEELSNVAGGGLFGDCPKTYNYWLCIFSWCPHFHRKYDYDNHVVIESCDNGYFSIPVEMGP